MLRQITYGLTALSMLAAPVAAFADDRDHASAREVRGDRRDVREERREYQDAVRNGSRGDVREERREYRDTVRERNQDQRDLAVKRDWQRDRQWQSGYRTWNRYDYNRPDPRYGGYYADRYYRQGNYQVRRLGYNDRVYRGYDNRYYCRRSDGTTGLIIGALGGGLLGNAVAPGGSKTLGAIIGGGLGAAVGQSIQRDGARCQ